MAQKKSLRVLLLILILAALTGLILFFAVKGTKKMPAKNEGGVLGGEIFFLCLINS